MCLGRMQRFHPEKDLDEQRVMMRVSVLRNVRRAACALNTPGGECPSGRAALGCCLLQWPLFRGGHKSDCRLQQPWFSQPFLSWQLHSSLYWRFASPCMNNAAALHCWLWVPPAEDMPFCSMCVSMLLY